MALTIPTFVYYMTVSDDCSVYPTDIDAEGKFSLYDNFAKYIVILPCLVIIVRPSYADANGNLIRNV